MTIPNFITIFRFLLVPVVIVLLLSDETEWALFCFIVAGVSDAVDGFIARHFNQRSTLGAYLDPMADKLLLVSVFVVLGFMRELPLWLVVAVVSRDALIICAVLLSTVVGNPVAMKPLLVSKANTAVQIILVGVVLAELAFDHSFGQLRLLLVVSSGILTAGSAAAYLVRWLKHLGRYEQAGS